MKIAIIGTGISGLSSAYLLYPHHDITVYEKNEVLGGHSRTIEVEVPEGKVPVDTGFIVFNHRNYPLLTGLFEHLQVPTAKSDMSFGVSVDNGWLEYGTQHLSDMFAQKRNLLRPAYWKMVRDILHFGADT
ncbi:MAG: NAD(P)-binding protein [Rickettsiales bacterium]|nr:NAD(P)-binding protein [Rickettsiales bacterium]